MWVWSPERVPSLAWRDVRSWERPKGINCVRSLTGLSCPSVLWTATRCNRRRNHFAWTEAVLVVPVFYSFEDASEIRLKAQEDNLKGPLRRVGPPFNGVRVIKSCWSEKKEISSFSVFDSNKKRPSFRLEKLQLKVRCGEPKWKVIRKRMNTLMETKQSLLNRRVQHLINVELKDKLTERLEKMSWNVLQKLSEQNIWMETLQRRWYLGHGLIENLLNETGEWHFN